MRLALVVVTIATLAGCATEPEYVWRKPGAGESDFYNDLGECRSRAFAVSNPTLFQLVMVQNNCLMGKGWRQVPRP
jgi:hypothetical protein